jgi:hypothetical protein
MLDDGGPPLIPDPGIPIMLDGGGPPPTPDPGIPIMLDGGGPPVAPVKAPGLPPTPPGFGLIGALSDFNSNFPLAFKNARRGTSSATIIVWAF